MSTPEGMAPTPLRGRAEAPAPGPIRPFHLPDVEGEDLESGLRVRFLPRREIPLVSATLVVDAGEALLQGERAGLAVLTGDALTGGTEGRSGTELAEAFESLGVSLRVSTGWDATALEFTAHADRLDETLDLLSEVLRSASFPANEVERVRRQRLAAIRQRSMDPSNLADDALARAVFPEGHPYARRLAGEVESVEEVDRYSTAAFFEERYRPARAGFVLVGDLGTQEVLGRATRHLGSWSGTSPAAPSLPSQDAEGDRPFVIVHRPGAVQSEVRVGLPAPSRGGSDETALEVGNAILGGVFTSRLNLNLRERHGFTYGVRSRFLHRRRGGIFSIGTAVQTEVTARALEEMLGELRTFTAEGPSEGEVGQARDYLAGVFPLRMETTAQLAARVAELLIFDLPVDHYHRYRDRVRDVEAETVASAVGRHVDPSAAAVVVVGDADALAGELEGVGLGAPEVVEP